MTTTAHDPAAALQVHLQPSPVHRSGSHGTGVSLHCGCGLYLNAEHSESETISPGVTLRGWELARRRHAEHVRDISRDLFAPTPDAAAPEDNAETRAVPTLDGRDRGKLSGAALAAFAREHGVRPDWHEPDEAGIGARVIGTHLDNAMGSRAGRMVEPGGLEYGEFNVVLTFTDEREGITRDVGVVNLATLLATAARAE